MKVIQGIDELRTYVGREIGVSDWLTITQERINEFARVTEDQQWIHVDPERARTELPFGSTLAHGFLTLALAPRFSREVYRVADIRMVINYGLNQVRFLAPVLTGSQLRMRIELLEVSERKDAYKTTSRFTFEVEGQPKPVCIAESLMMLYPGKGELVVG